PVTPLRQAVQERPGGVALAHTELDDRVGPAPELGQVRQVLPYVGVDGEELVVGHAQDVCSLSHADAPSAAPRLRMCAFTALSRCAAVCPSFGVARPSACTARSRSERLRIWKLPSAIAVPLAAARLRAAASLGRGAVCLNDVAAVRLLGRAAPRPPAGGRCARSPRWPPSPTALAGSGA